MFQTQIWGYKSIMNYVPEDDWPAELAIITSRRTCLWCEVHTNFSFHRTVPDFKMFSGAKSSSSTVFAQHENFLKLVGFKFLDEVTPPSDVQHKLDNYFKFLVVRDPWTRLLSAYRDNFETKDSTVQESFLNYFGRLILERYRENASK